MMTRLSGILFVGVMLTHSLAYAERDCVRRVDTADGVRIIHVRCESSYTRTDNPDIIRNPRNVQRAADRYFEKVNWSSERAKDRAANQSSTKNNLDSKVADIRDKERSFIDAVRIKEEAKRSKR